MNINSVKNNFREGIENVTVAGRVKFARSFGKLSFVVISDQDNTIQLGFKTKLKLPNMWDIVSATGTTGFTQKGEPTIWCDNFTTVAECKGNVPEKYHGIEDKSVIYSRRSRIVAEIRKLLNDENFIEIETPILTGQPTGAAAKPFVTHHNAENEDKYLRIATEVHLKMALIGGIERVYEIGKIFRNEGVDRTHNPEFTSIEIYQSYANLNTMKTLFLYLISKLFGTVEYDSFEYDEVVAKYGEDFDNHLNNLTFVTGQPIEQTPLCKRREDGKADRFEVYWRGMEIANAYNEINCYTEQAERVAEGDDGGLLEALKYGMPPTGGIGIGIDRLVMILTDSEHIHDVIMFPR